jgi:capsular polysaccharide biosynthesis protein
LGLLFDTLVVGQYLGGVDPRNNGGQKSGPYLNESALYSMREMPFEWKHVGGRWQPFVDRRPLAIIHVHCKSLKSFRSDRLTRPINDYQVDELLPALVPNTDDTQTKTKTHAKALYFRYKSPENYYHWLIYMLSNLRHVDTAGIEQVYIQNIHPGLLKPSSYIVETLKILIPTLQSIRAVPQCPDGVQEVTYCPNPDPLDRGEPYAKEAYLFLKDRLMSHIASRRGTYPKRLYISRARATKRTVKNESDLVAHLTPLGVHVLYLEDLGGLEQMAYFYNADLIISPHGAGLANLMFCKESTRVIELCSKTMTHMKHFEHIAAVMKLNYTRFQDVIPDSESNDSNMTVKLEYFKLLEQANYLRTFALSNCPLLSILHG